ncbi:adenylate/guanylate cyclase domain-containing protein [Streptomyces xylophagus]|uniref:adenylate/guanylate cyclase domain-containing protein n=1 Tax=Streptomyces xylophagus TaxID=285514 RepID=UPI000996F1DC|nr:adenylate/guanylate cyclase domain-containing protein [Streptomyces xylophagus]
MDSNHKEYDFKASALRIGEYLTGTSGSYEEVNSLPDRDRLTYSNGFYANCAAIFVDIRDSSKLPSHYKRPRLARLYRAYLSELVAIFNGYAKTREINIAGDAAWAVVNTPNKPDVDRVFWMAYTANSMVKILNYKMVKAGYETPVRIGIGASWGRALMIKAGYNGSGIQDIVYMGDVVNDAAKLAAHGSSQLNVPPIVASEDFHFNLSDDNQKLLSQDRYRLSCYSGEVGNAAMEEWYEENCR